MYFKYASNSTWNCSEVARDLAKLCCGYSLNQLSASCDQVNSAILLNEVAADWTYVDDAISTNASLVIIKRADTAGIDKIFGINFSNNYFQVGVAKTWNDVTHTGTYTYNLDNRTWTGSGNIYGLYINGTYPVIVYGVVQPGFFMFQFYNNGWGWCSGGVELNRNAAFSDFLNPGYGYSSAVALNGCAGRAGSNYYPILWCMPQNKNYTSAGFTGPFQYTSPWNGGTGSSQGYTLTWCYNNNGWTYSYQGNMPTTSRNMDETSVTIAFPFQLLGYETMIGPVYGILGGPNNATISTMDDVVINNQTYIRMMHYADYVELFVPKG